ncbi:prolyl aminopeptidase [Micromonosporaceae bacterium Da 78-11]
MTDFLNGSGLLDVGDGHRLYWEDWGNPAGVPVICLHGGPGAGFRDSHKALFDPAVHHVLFHDQRGSGRSTPLAGTAHNTTPDLIRDIAALMRLLGWESAHLAGGSWGSALSLLFAIEHPQRVRSLVLWGVYLVRQFENDWVNEGYPRFHFPAEWERFIGMVPEHRRTDGNAVMAYYAERMRDRDPVTARRFAVEWTLWETTLTSTGYQPAEVERQVTADASTVGTALLETHYFQNGCFVPANHILESVAAIRDIACTVVQGRFDMCTPPISAYDLAQAYGDRLSLRWVDAGHLRTDAELLAGLRVAMGELDRVRHQDRRDALGGAWPSRTG